MQTCLCCAMDNSELATLSATQLDSISYIPSPTTDSSMHLDEFYTHLDINNIIRSSSTSLYFHHSDSGIDGHMGHLAAHDNYMHWQPQEGKINDENLRVAHMEALKLPPPPTYEQHIKRFQDDEVKTSTYNCLWLDCQVNCTEQEQLVRHIEKKHVDQRTGDDYTCFWQGCPRKKRPFNARYKLLIHMRVHSGDKPNRCTFDGCTKAFSRSENLKIHLRSHTGERPYPCQNPECKKAFSNSSDRAKHQRTHIDTRPYACQIIGCSKRYTDPSSLRKHLKNHTNGKEQRKKNIKNGFHQLNHLPAYSEQMSSSSEEISQNVDYGLPYSGIDANTNEITNVWYNLEMISTQKQKYYADDNVEAVYNFDLTNVLQSGTGNWHSELPINVGHHLIPNYHDKGYSSELLFDEENTLPVQKYEKTPFLLADVDNNCIMI